MVDFEITSIFLLSGMVTPRGSQPSLNVQPHALLHTLSHRFAIIFLLAF